jgi:UDPglucose 6-dehydrogenase
MDKAREELAGVELCRDIYELAEGCDALILATEWDEYRYPDWPRIRAAMRGDILIDGRNFYDPETMVQAGFRYRGIGRGIATLPD